MLRPLEIQMDQLSGHCQGSPAFLLEIKYSGTVGTRRMKSLFRYIPVSFGFQSQEESEGCEQK